MHTRIAPAPRQRRRRFFSLTNPNEDRHHFSSTESFLTQSQTVRSFEGMQGRQITHDVRENCALPERPMTRSLSCPPLRFAEARDARAGRPASSVMIGHGAVATTPVFTAY